MMECPLGPLSKATQSSPNKKSEPATCSSIVLEDCSTQKEMKEIQKMYVCYLVVQNGKKNLSVGLF